MRCVENKCVLLHGVKIVITVEIMMVIILLWTRNKFMQYKKGNYNLKSKMTCA